MKPSTMKPTETWDALIIFSGNPNNAIGKWEPEILNLTVMMKKGVPVVSFVAVWDEGGHFGSYESEETFPDAVFQALSPDAIVNWLQELLPVQHVNIVDWESIRKNPELKAWCEKHHPKQAEEPFRIVLAGTHQNAYSGEELYDLSLAYDENTKPVIKWTVTWRGGESHASSADGTVMIPLVLYPRITPEKLVEWMMERLLLSSSVMRAVDRNAILSNPELEEWCTQIRQKYGRMRLKTSMDDCYGKIENPLDLPEAQEIIAQMELPKGVQFQMNSDISVYHNKTEPYWSIFLDRGQDPYPPFVISCDNKWQCLNSLLKVLADSLVPNLAKGDMVKMYSLELMIKRALIDSDNFYELYKSRQNCLHVLYGGDWGLVNWKFVRFS